MTSAHVPPRPELSAHVPPAADISAAAPLVNLTASAAAPPTSDLTASCLPTPGLEAQVADLPDTNYNVIVFLIDDAGREYYDYLEQSSYNPASPGSRVDPVDPAWCANQWTEVAQDESTFPYPPSPVLRSLAVNGLVLSRMHVAAMCSPTRASLITGRSNIQHTLGNAIQGNAAADPITGIPFAYTGTTIYQRMEQQGSPYGRFHVGKWHLSNFPGELNPGFTELGLANTIASYKQPVERGYASFYYGSIENLGTAPPGFESVGAQSYEANNHVVATHDARKRTIIDRASLESADFTIEIEKANCLIAEVREARQLIEDAADDGQPFLMNIEFHAVHDPTGWDEIDGVNLHDNGYHSYGTANPGGTARVGSGSGASHPGIVKAFVESVDTAMGLILDAMTPEQEANTMIVFISDNGSTSDMLASTVGADTVPGDSGEWDVLEPGKPTVPASTYNQSHSKRSPWQGGIAAACVVKGPGIVNPGNGTVPRFWPGLCGIEDLYAQICRWTGTHFPSELNNYTHVLDRACKDTSNVGRDVYIQRAFQNGYSEDMFSDDQGGGIRSLSAQTAEGWKLIWLKASGAYNGEDWWLYDMPNDPQEATDIWLATKTSLGGTPTVQDVYDALTSGQKAQFNKMYRVLETEGTIPPGLAVTLS